MLLAALVLALPQPAIDRIALAPCNPDPMKSLGCNAQAHAPAAPRREAQVPIACNSDPLKGAACHAHVALARAEARRKSERQEELASAAD
ncbi:MAG: hypothetical protein WCL10_19710 [Novosphingobium sp.]|uniref:hypothetical protein n=1 Tax=Novosphingobium sp. TaxID=1874826 RepID=UPI003019AFD9